MAVDPTHDDAGAKHEEKLDKLEEKADKLEKKLDAVGKKVDKAEKKGDAVEKKLDKIEKKYDKLEAKADKLEQKLDTAKKKGSFKGLRRLQVPGETAALRRARDDARLAPEDRGRLTEVGAAVVTLQGDDDDKFERDLDGKESILDKLEQEQDKREKEFDKIEKALDELEKFGDKQEKELDDCEKELDEAEKDLDEEKRKRSPRRTTLRRGRRPARARSARRRSSSRRTRRRRVPAKGEIRRLIAALRRGGARSQAAARRLEALGRLATPALCRAYDAPEEHIRWQVVNLLGYTKDPRAIPLLARRGVHDPEWHPRWRSIWALTSVDDGRAAAILRRQVRHGSPGRRRNASVALSLFQDPAALPALRRGLYSPESRVRWESASCLVGYADPGAAGDILRLYPRESDPTIRREMIKSLGGVSRRPVLRFLRQRLTEPDPDLRAAAVRSLASSLNGGAHAVLVARLAHEPMGWVRREIRELLRSLPSPAAGAAT